MGLKEVGDLLQKRIVWQALINKYRYLNSKQFLIELKKDAYNTQFFKKLAIFNYLSIKNYDFFEKVIHQIAVYELSVQILIALRNDFNLDSIKKDHALIASMKVIGQAQNMGLRSLWLAPTLLEAFSYSRLPTKIAALNRVCPVGLIFLPVGKIKNHEGKSLKWILFYHALPGDKLTEDIFFESEENSFASLFWCTQLDDSLEMYAGHDALSILDERLIVDGGEKCLLYSHDDCVELDSSEVDFVKRIPNLIIQTLLYMQMEKITLPPTPEPQPQGFGGKGKTKYQKILPLIIGENYLIKTQREPTGVSRPHGSPVTHWRSGHWRCQPYGGKDNLAYKTIWIEPILVNKPGGMLQLHNI